jgi:hypothetical protein
LLLCRRTTQSASRPGWLRAGLDMLRMAGPAVRWAWHMGDVRHASIALIQIRHVVHDARPLGRSRLPNNNADRLTFCWAKLAVVARLMQPTRLQRLENPKVSTNFADPWPRRRSCAPISRRRPKRPAFLAWAHAGLACHWKQKFNASLRQCCFNRGKRRVVL